jgi:NDP-sugar pyrophosphorylase family protein
MKKQENVFSELNIIKMKFAIIAAGEGSRLAGEGISVPKPLVKINGTPMIQRIIESAASNNFSSVHCIINSSSVDLKNFLLNNNFGIPVELIVKSTPSSLHSLYELSAHLHDSYFCLSTADTIFRDDEFSNYISYCEDNITEADGILAVTKFIDDEKPLYVKVDNNSDIESFSDNFITSAAVTGGLYFFSPQIIKVIKQAVESGTQRLRNFLKMLPGQGYIIKAYNFSKIIDVDHAGDIKLAENFLSSSKINGVVNSSNLKGEINPG